MTEKVADIDAVLCATTGLPFYNTSPLNFQALASDPYNVAKNLEWYLAGFSPSIAQVLAAFDFSSQIARLDDAGLLYPVIQRFAHFDLRPQTISGRQMGTVVEDLVRVMFEDSSGVASEYRTPHDVVRLMVDLLFESKTKSDTLTIYDPACGTGGTLLEARKQIETRGLQGIGEFYGQEINAETYALCRASMLINGIDNDRIALGNSLSHDRFPGMTFDYLISAPPFGLEWKTIESLIRHEAEDQGFGGRFGAGLPRINDASLLFLQHMISKMRPSAEGGSRLAVIFNGSPLDTGDAGSGESEIRRWILENDLLETVVALPDQLLHNTGIATYFWILTNCKADELRGKVVLLNARDEWQKMRRSQGNKRKYLAADEVEAITDVYRNARVIAQDPRHPWHTRIVVLRNEDLANRKVVIERPLRARFELTEKRLNQLTRSAAFRNTTESDGLAAALRPLIGSSWPTRKKALDALRAATSAGKRSSWPTTAAFESQVVRIIRTPDPQGEIQKTGTSVEPDPALNDSVRLPISRDPKAYLREEIHPRSPDAWIDDAKSRIGYEIPLTHFFVRRIKADFDHLKQFARLKTAKVTLSAEDGGGGRPYLSVQDLHHVDSAVALPEAPVPRPASLTSCQGGDLVGWPGNWRLLPPNFGEAVTPMFVLQPLNGNGRMLTEWLNSNPDHPYGPITSRKLLDIQVPVAFTDPEIEDLLEAVQEGRRKIQVAASGTLPNVFSGAQTDVQHLRDEIRSAAQEARLVSELMRPVEDPVVRAEWSYPHHIASLARRYRISTHPTEQKDGLLKLGEGIARVLGILALRELIAKDGFTPNTRKLFRTGATFGTWTTILNRFAEDINVPRLSDLARLTDSADVRALLATIKGLRNDAHHSHGVRTSHETERAVETLEPLIVSAITAVNWLAGNPWDLVDRCEYKDESSYRIIGLTLRGSHPSWEPFDRPSTFPLKPNHIYVNGAGAAPIDLWPLAAVDLCAQCRTRELFLLNQCQDETLILRSLEEHELEIQYPLPD